jgi:hypothetical protein
MSSLGLLACLAGPVWAGQVLYATASTPGRVDAFCLTPNGGIATKPKFTTPTGGRLPRRLLVSPDNKILYVAQIDRVEFYEILDGGGLRKVPQTQVPEPPLKGLNPRDVALSADGRSLYVPDVRRDKLMMFALGTDGLPISREPTSCMFGPPGAGYENLLVRTDTPIPLLYIGLTHGRGEVVTYSLGPDGRFIKCLTDEDADQPNTAPPICTVPLGPEGCDNDADTNQPISRRKRMAGPGPLILDGNRIFISERFRRKVSVFDLSPAGLFSLNDANPPKWRQPRASGTTSGIRYNGLVKANNTIIGTQFSEGRVDAYKLRNDGNLPGDPTHRTDKNVRSSPVRMTVRGNMLYVGGGDDDRVQVYRLSDEGVPRDNSPFSESDRQKHSFPNDVLIVDVPSACN